jgi:hypothetical protein
MIANFSNIARSNTLKLGIQKILAEEMCHRISRNDLVPKFGPRQILVGSIVPILAHEKYDSKEAIIELMFRQAAAASLVRE